VWLLRHGGFHENTSLVMSGKSNLPVNESPITRNALLAHSRFDSAPVRYRSVRSILHPRRCRQFRLQKGREEFADGHFFNFYLSNSPLPRLPPSQPASHSSLLFSRQHGQFCSRAVQSFLLLPFSSLTLKRHTPRVLSRLPL